MTQHSILYYPFWLYTEDYPFEMCYSDSTILDGCMTIVKLLESFDINDRVHVLYVQIREVEVIDIVSETEKGMFNARVKVQPGPIYSLFEIISKQDKINDVKYKLD